VIVAACGGTVAHGPLMALPPTGLLLLDLRSGVPLLSIAVGSDPVAVTLSEDGRVAYIADSAPGDVYAVEVPSGRVRWKAHLGGAPFGLLVHRDRLYVSLFAAAAIVVLNPSDGGLVARDETLTDPATLAVDADGQVVAATGNAFGVALAGGGLWTADYRSATLVHGDAAPIPLPLPVHPFWLASGPGGTLLIAAEGDSEDTDPGAVFSYDPMTSSFKTLARPRDPDQVVAWGTDVFVAAHGDHEVLRIAGGPIVAWAKGAPAVALAPDSQLNLLVVAVNGHE